MNSPELRNSSRGTLLRAGISLVSVLTLVAATTPGYAAAPASGTIAASATKPVAWDGDAPGVPPAVGAAQESTCVDGANCDVFTLNVSGAPADWAGKQIVIAITWSLPTTDYDLYIHKDTLQGPLVAKGNNGGSTDPNPTSDGAALNPATTGTGKYIVHVLYGVTPGNGDEYHGTATVKAASGPTPVGGTGGATRSATYITGAATGISFSNTIPLKAPLTTRDGEPSNRTDYVGNTYVGAIRGFPAGVDLWHINLNPKSASYDPFMRVPEYRGQPDAFSPTPEADLGGDGGGDIDLAVPFLPPGATPNPSATPTLAFSSLIAANISTGVSTDGGNTFQKNPLGNCTGGVCADDRQWEEFLGQTTVYMLYRTLEPAVTQIQRSDDSGLTFGPASTAGAIGQVGYIDVHQSDGVVYVSGNSGQVGVGVPSIAGQAPLTTDYNVVQVASDPNGVGHLFFPVKVADDGTKNGTAYVCYSNENDVFLQHSTDQGKTWSKPVKVNGGLPTKVNLFPWFETGPLPGSVGVVWYGTTASSNSDVAEWKVYYAQSFDATATKPTFHIAEVTEPEHFIHGSNISEGGLTGAANRNLIDYFQVSFDPNGAAVIAFTDDHNDYDGHTYVAHQLTGPSIKTGTALPAATEGKALALPPGDKFPPRVPGLNGEQVTDYAQDLQESSLARVRVNDPSDLVWTRYDTSGSGNKLAIAATMRVTDLSIIPGQTTWQMSFAVNAPHSVLSPTGTYSFGVSDHADQFYVQADTDVDGNQVFTYGTVARASDGKLIYTQKGTADSGEFNQSDNTISVQVSVAKLNALLTAAKHPLIENGTVVAGLRSRSYTIEVVPPVSGQASRQGRRDIARGGTQFVVHDSAFPYPAPSASPTPLPETAASPGASPSPTAPTRTLANISTRVAVKAGEGAGIGGFIKRTANSKRVLIRAVGPSIAVDGKPVAGTLTDPSIDVYDAAGQLVMSNDNWRSSSQQAAITASGLAPADDREPAMILNLTGSEARNKYTAIVRGKNDAEGIALVEVYDLEAESFADLGNVSTRGPVGTGNDVMIGGFIVRDVSFTNQSQNILVRGIGPSLTGAGVKGALADPFIDLHDGQGNIVASNDNWESSPDAAALTATGIAPSNPKEAAILRTLAPGAYTVVLRGADNGTGVGVVEAYNLGNQ
jgi:hypothetical protein